jgi:hypothetical protein
VRRGLASALVGATLVLGLTGCGSQSSRDPALQNLVNVMSSQDCFSQPVRMLSPRHVFGAPAGFARLASERAAIGCTPTRAWVLYLSFRTRRQLHAALRRYRQLFQRHVCSIGRAVFLYASHYDASAAYYMGDFCSRMDGQPLGPF